MNRFNGYREFLERWRTPAAVPGAPPLRQSLMGNRNLSGSAVDTAAYSFAPGQSGFTDSIEPGIRPLVLYLVEEVGLVTYSSCEGHLPGAASPFRPAHVGVLHHASLPAGRQGGLTAELLVRLLEVAAHRTMRALEQPAVGVRVIEDELDTELGPQPCLDVWFLPIHGGARMYFERLPALMERYQRELVELLASVEAVAARAPSPSPQGVAERAAG